MFTLSRGIEPTTVYGMGKPKRVTAVRLDDDQLRRAEAMASERRIGVSTLLRQIFDVALDMKPGAFNLSDPVHLLAVILVGVLVLALVTC